jgi:hypothetical protein
MEPHLFRHLIASSWQVDRRYSIQWHCRTERARSELSKQCLIELVRNGSDNDIINYNMQRRKGIDL